MAEDVIRREADAPAEANGDRDYVSSLARGLEILRAFSRRRKRMTLSEVAAETGLTRAAARRFLLTLVREGYATSDGKLFDLTPRVLELGFSVMSSMGVWDVARPFLAELAERCEESVSAAVLDVPHVVYVAGAQYHRVISVGVTLGSRLPAHATATGRVLLAALPPPDRAAALDALRLEPVTPRTVTDRATLERLLDEIAARGWSLVEEELELGLLSVATPLRRRSGEIAGAINIGVPTLRATPADIEARLLPPLRECAGRITQALAN